MTFSTKKDATEHFRKILYRYEIGKCIPEPDANELAALIERHPEADQKIGVGIAYFTTHVTPYNNRAFLIVRADGSSTDFSFLKCLDDKAPSILSEVVKALRAEVDEDIRRAKAAYFAEHADAEGKVPCPLTGKLVTINEADADHAEPYRFQTLAITFLKANRIELSAGLITAPADNQYQRRLLDRNLASEWIAFHHDLACIRIVERSINIAGAHKSRVKSRDRQLQLPR
jgi:hypothetical protein